MEVLKALGLTYTFPGQDKPIFTELNFSLEEGEFILLSGESGCGKSTLLNCLNGVIPHVWQGQMEGEVLVGGLETTSTSLKELVQQVGTLWQDVESQLTQLSVEDELVFGLENIGLSREESDERLNSVLPLVSLEREASLQDLSGGQKQRLALGALLAMLPRVILLDEPLANLDLPGAHRFLIFLKELCRQGKTVLMVEHRLDLSARYVDRLLYMDQGRITLDLRNRDRILQEEALKGNMAGRYPTSFGDRKAVGEQAAAGKGKGKSTGSFDRPSLELEALWAAYGKKKVWSGLDLRLEPGERLVLLGENGCGKTTFLKLLGGVRRGLKAGYRQFKLLGSPAKKIRKPFYSRRMGFVMQNPNHQLFMQTVELEVALNAPGHEEVQNILELFGLEELSGRHPLSLSQGQKRLLAVAASVAHQPQILLLDEPTIGQDYNSLQKIIQVLNYLNREQGMTIITATHDRKAAENLGDRALAFKRGEVKILEGREKIGEYWNNISTSF